MTKNSTKLTCRKCSSMEIVKVKNKSEFLRKDIDQYTCLKCGCLLA